MMKRNQLSAFLLALAAMVFITSCDTETDPIVPEPDLSVVDDDVAVNATFEDLDNLALGLLLEAGSEDTRILDDDICENADIDIDEDDKRITIDFGEGCTTNGITRKGAIIFTYTGSLEATSLLLPGFTFTAAFDNYEVNGLKVEGTRIIRNLGIDFINGAVRLAIEIRDGVITWPDNTFVTYSSDQVRTLTFGDLTGDTISDYEASVTGSAIGKTREGFDYSATITTPLLITQECVETGVLTPSLGVVTFNYRGIEVGLDYGFGTCDNTVTITYPGGAKEVDLD